MSDKWVIILCTGPVDNWQDVVYSPRFDTYQAAKDFIPEVMGLLYRQGGYLNDLGDFMSLAALRRVKVRGA